MPQKDTPLRILNIKSAISQHFKNENWADIALLTNSKDIIYNHDRLFKSLRFGDDDYPSNIIEVLQMIEKVNTKYLDIVEQYIHDKFGDDSIFVSSKKIKRQLRFPRQFVKFQKIHPQMKD